jgi:DNA primase small subunit
MENLEAATRAHIKAEFRRYYFERNLGIKLPTDVPRREFGFLDFDGRMVRHISFQNDGDLHAFLVKDSPRGAFVSSAKYEYPSLPMEQKCILSTNLIFDIDSGDLNLPCQKEHDFYVCEACGTSNRSNVDRCPFCGSEKVQLLHWACPHCMKASLDEALKLVDVLESDLGLKKSSISLYFSGNRGHHVEVSDSEYDQLDQRGRAELVDYVTGKGLTPKTFGFTKGWSNYDVSKIPTVQEPGWRGRFARYIYRAYNQDTKRFIVTLYTGNRNELTNLMDSVVGQLTTKVDAAVTTDMHRIFRMPGTLHDKSGLVKKLLKDPNEDPFISAVVLDSSPVNVYVNFAPEFTLKGQKFGPYKRSQVKLPSFAAVYLECKGLAKVRTSSPA